MREIKLLPHLLKWGSPTNSLNLVDDAWRIHLEFLTKQIAYRAKTERNRKGDEILNALISLPTPIFKKILRSPETCHRIYLCPDLGSGQLWEYLEQCILAENVATGLALNSNQPIWNSTGEFVCINAKVERKGQVCNGIIVDYESPFALHEIHASKFRPNFGTYVPFSSKERANIQFKCFSAIELLSENDATVWNFVKNLALTVMPRRDTLNPTFKGSSNRGIIGRVNLINPHVDDVDFGWVINSLIHESIHILLYLFEEQEVFFDSDEIAFDGRLRSPWSGNMVNPRAFLHGAFVWSGLYHFWSKPEREIQFPSDVRNEMIRFCSKGFLAGGSHVLVAKFGENIRTDLLETLGIIDENMRSAINK